MIPSDNGPDSPDLSASRRRGMMLAGFGIASCAAAAFIFWKVSSKQGRSLVAAPSSPIETTRPLPRAASNMVMVRVEVRVREENGKYLPVGFNLPGRVSLELEGEEGKRYEAYFDRVGTWGMEVAPGDFIVPAEQENLGSWKWELTGPKVAANDGGGYRVSFSPGISPTLELVLY